uniref:Vomeronasal type-1 receptor n=1 Tax=Mustela putorius furo TaxID=9669 RepID=M3Y4A3_MUSPF
MYACCRPLTLGALVSSTKWHHILVLFKHKQQIQHIHSHGLSPRPFCETKAPSSILIFFFFFFKILFIYLTERDTARERTQREWESENQASHQAGSLMRALVPGPWDHDPSLRQRL